MRNAVRIGVVFSLALVTWAIGPSLLDAAVTLPVNADLELWLDASNTASLNGGTITDGAKVTAWADLATDNDATQTATNRQPVWVESVAGLGGQSAVRFDGSNVSGQGDRLSITDMPLGQGVTTFTVAINSLQTTDGASCCRPLLSEDGTNLNDGGIGFGFGRDSTGYTTDFHVYRNDNYFFTQLPSTPGSAPDPDNLFHIYEVTYTTANMSLYEDAGLVTSKTNTLTPTGVDYHIGGNINVNARHYAGDIAEMIIYDRTLTTAEVNAVGFYLQDKYSISTSSYDGTTLQTDGDWDEAASWSGGAAPGSTTAVFAGGGSTATVDQASQEAGVLVIGHGMTTNPGDGTVSVVTGGDLSVTDGLTLGQTGYTGTLSLTGGNVAVGGGVLDGGGTSTINVDNGTMTVGNGFEVDQLRVGYLPSGVSADRSGTVTVADGNVTIGSATNRTALYLGYNSAGNTYDASGTLDLSAATQFDAYLSTLTLGKVTSNASNGWAQGTLILAPTNNIDATEILVSDSEMHMATQPTSTIELGTTNNFKADTFTVAGYRGYALVEFATTGTLTLTGSSGAEADLLIANCDRNTNNPVNGHMDMSGGTFNATLGELLIGYDNWGKNAPGSVGKLTFADGTITANSLTLGDAVDGSDPGRGVGTLDMSGGSLTVNGNATLGTGTSISSGTINQTGGTINVTGEVAGGVGTSTLRVDKGSMTIGTGLSVDTLRVGYYTGTGNTIASLTVNGGAVSIGTGSEILDIGRREPQTPSTTQGTADFSGASSVNINVADVRLGTIPSMSTNSDYEGDAGGTLKLSTAGNNTITANNVYLGNSPSYGNMSLPSLLELGEASNTINTNLLRVGGYKSEGTVTIASGGTLTLNGKAGAGSTTNLEIGENYVSTGTISVGLMDLSGGTFNAELDHLYIGRHNGGNGNGEGTLIMDAGTVTANSVQMAIDNGSDKGNTKGTLTMRGGSLAVSGSVSDGGGTSTINVDGGTMTVGSGFAVDNLRVGLNGRTGSLTVNGGAVQVNAGNLDIGHRDDDQNGNTVGSADFSNASSVNLDVTNLRLGTTNEGPAKGSLELSATGTNVINASTILVGESDGQFQSTVALQSKITLGNSNTINVGTLTVGGRKTNGLVAFGTGGGTLTLGSSSDPVDNLRIGYNNVVTNGDSVGHLDGSGGTINAYVTNVVIGHRSNNFSASGYEAEGSGTLTLADGDFHADSILLGEHVISDGAASGTINLQGGTLTAGLIDDGGGTATFNFTGGTLHVDTFGFTLVQDGGVLDAEGSPGLTHITGDYIQNGGILHVDITGDDPGDQDPAPPGDDNIGFDLYVVEGAALLDGIVRVDLQGGYWPAFGTTFDVLTAESLSSTSGSIAVEYLVGGGDTARSTFRADIVDIAGGQALRLTSLMPEPGTLLIWSLLAGLGMGLGWRRRK